MIFSDFCCRSTPKFRSGRHTLLTFVRNMSISTFCLMLLFILVLVVRRKFSFNNYLNSCELLSLFTRLSNKIYDIILGCDSNANYSHSTDNLDSSKYYGIDVNSSCKPTNYLNPTYNSKINLCINDDYISIVNNTKNNNNNHHHHENNNSNNRNPSGFRHKRESKFFDENMNYAATPLINNAHETKIFRKTLNSSFPTGK